MVFGTALTNVFNQSLISIFGLLYGEHLQNMGQGTIGAALVMNINSVALNFSGNFCISNFDSSKYLVICELCKFVMMFSLEIILCHGLY